MSRRDRRRLAGGAALVAGLWVLVAPSGTTYAAWSDFATISGTVGAGVWLTEGDPPLPTQCIGMVFDRIIIGTNKNDQLTGTDDNDLIFGLQGKDVIRGLGGQDCLVGGNGKDELLGEDHDDVLVGGNAKDALDGGGDDDVCDGGRGKNTLINCEPSTPITVLFSAPEAAVVATPSVMSVPALEPSTDEPASNVAPEPDGGASVEDPPEATLVDGPEPAATDGDVTAAAGDPVEAVQPRGRGSP